MQIERYTTKVKLKKKKKTKKNEKKKKESYKGSYRNMLHFLQPSYFIWGNLPRKRSKTKYLRINIYTE